MARKLKDIRIEKGYTQSELAKKIGMTQPTLAKIEKGVQNIPEVYHDKLYFHLGTTEIEEIPKKEEIDDELLEISIEIIDSIVDATDMSRDERMDLLHRVYAIVEEVSVKNISNEELAKEVEELKQKAQQEVKIKKENKNFLKSLFTKK